MFNMLANNRQLIKHTENNAVRIMNNTLFEFGQKRDSGKGKEM